MTSPRTPLLEQVLVVLNRHDPIGLGPGEDREFAAPWDEYEPEARDLAALLEAHGTISAEQVDEVWTRWFSVPTDDAEPIAADLRALVAG